MIPMPKENAPVWTDAEELECVLTVPEAPNVMTFAFRPPSGARFSFKAGQFVTLELPLPGGPVQRTYTISSSPTTSAHITVTVKAQPDSIGTRWMHDHLRPGMRLRAWGPAGLFHLPADPDGKYLFISAGSGITPMMSMTSYLWERGEDPDITFIHCALSPQNILFRQKLEYMAGRVSGLKLNFCVDRDDPYTPWTGYRGRFNQLMLGLMAPDYLERDVYCCGPAPFMEAVRDMLNALGYDMTRYHQESFEAPAASPAELSEFHDVIPDESVTAEIAFARSGVTVPCTQTDTVLQVARGAGLNIPSGCTFGLCGTCKIRKSAGEVHMVHNGGISEEDIAEGYILACCSHPIGTVSVDV